MRLLICGLVFLLGFTSAQAESDVELLNATLVAKFHFAEKARDGQMVGAYQVSFRNNGDTPVRTLSLLLNPGLKVDQVVGANNARLKITSRIAPVKGRDYLELTQVEVTLDKPLIKNKTRQEIVVHYHGFLQDLSVTGLEGVKETLHPDFTMIRPQGFAYPVVAAPLWDSVQAAWQHKRFHQVAFLEIPGTNTIVGNLDTAEKTTNGNITRFEMKSAQPSDLMTLAVGPYSISKNGAIAYAALSPVSDDAASVIEEANHQTARIQADLGLVPNGQILTMAELPQGYKAQPTYSTIFLTPEKLSPHDTSGLVFEALFSLWKCNQNQAPNHWASGIDIISRDDLNEATDSADTSQTAFTDVKAMLEKNPLIEKTAIAEFVAEGLGAELDTVNILAFAVLYDLLGRDDFYALVRGLRATLSVGYADMQSVADYLMANNKNKKARKFAENWFMKGRIGKDMAKAKSFDELVALYR